MKDVARYFQDFLTEKTCGKCMPCRDGIRQMLTIVERIIAGKGKHGDLESLEELGSVVMDTSLCALGRTAPKALLATIRRFRDEPETRIGDEKCPAGVCEALLGSAIEPGTCTGCDGCAVECPVDAVFTCFRDEYEALLTFTIDPATCTGCGVCARKCPADAVFTHVLKPGESAPKLREGRKLHEIDQSKCTKCGACFEACRFDAVRRE